MTEMNIMQVMNYIGDKIPSDSAYAFRQRLASLPDSAAPYFFRAFWANLTCLSRRFIL